jgi:hypothetical protein
VPSWRWPLKVDEFLSVLHDPDDPWWHRVPSCQYPAGEVAELDLDRLRCRLLAGSQEWDSDLLGFCLRQGLGYLPVPAPSEGRPGDVATRRKRGERGPPTSVTGGTPRETGGCDARPGEARQLIARVRTIRRS